MPCRGGARWKKKTTSERSRAESHDPYTYVQTDMDTRPSIGGNVARRAERQWRELGPPLPIRISPSRLAGTGSISARPRAARSWPASSRLDLKEQSTQHMALSKGLPARSEEADSDTFWQHLDLKKQCQHSSGAHIVCCYRFRAGGRHCWIVFCSLAMQLRGSPRPLYALRSPPPTHSPHSLTPSDASPVVLHCLYSTPTLQPTASSHAACISHLLQNRAKSCRVYIHT
ncbi:hypothetical protein CC78DRAFT_574666 [Lojkania enalia]|uniref:Uncharacterized protein n=1 Tax=Lojkania enalia TaxID=147567 RepID=A0A9P4TQP3_9PLEO|nr:hypothetical protein CC78DRAFT_574666 [Didymosphaeria enalia]